MLQNEQKHPRYDLETKARVALLALDDTSMPESRYDSKMIKNELLELEVSSDDLTKKTQPNERS